MAGQIKVLFLCTGNSCRSQMAEALLRHLDQSHPGPQRFAAYSAGSHPAGYIHPLAITALDQMSVPLVHQRSKSWDELRDETFDVVITLCDAAAAAGCPAWCGAPISVHWGMPDPVALVGSDAQRIDAAVQTARRIKRRLEHVMHLDFTRLPKRDVQGRLQALASM